MAKLRGTRMAFGCPGIPARWTHANKAGVGTAYSGDSRIWFTLFSGCVTEVYYPTIDRPQIRDLQYLITDGSSFFHDEKRSLVSRVERATPHALSYRVTNEDPDGRYRITKMVLSAPHLPCLLVRTKLEGDPDLLSRLRLYALLAPHLEGTGGGDSAYVFDLSGRQVLAASSGPTWVVLAADAPFRKLSCGYVGHSDGWTDLAGNFEMDWEFDQALDGNVSLTGEIDLSGGRREFVLALAFGDGLNSALASAFQALGTPFADHERRFNRQWTNPYQRIMNLEPLTRDAGKLYRASYSLLLAHEDKTYPGAFIAALSIPWGEAKGDEDLGGYHLVWTRDLVNSVSGLMAAGNTTTPLRALVYLAVCQQEDGGFPQNFWINGVAYWRGVQLDEMSFPVMLAWRLAREGALGEFDPYPMVLLAAEYLVEHGPATGQERWEENAGYCPSTLAANIAALICAAAFARQRGNPEAADYLETYADFLESHVERWTVTTEGTLVPGLPRHYIRVHPVSLGDLFPDEDPNRGVVHIANRAPGQQADFPAKEIVDPGFLELVRYGIRRPDDPIMVESLRVIDAVLRVETPAGPVFRRYNHDGYGQRSDGGPFEGFGVGRPWPLLSGERGHYELAAGHDPGPYLRVFEGLASPTGLLPEQVWDERDIPDKFLWLGQPTGAAMPLMWAHAEYLKLLRSTFDRVPFDRIPEVYARYSDPLLPAAGPRRAFEIWKSNRRPRTMRKGETLRVQQSEPFRLHYSLDDWATVHHVMARRVLRFWYVDVELPIDQIAPLRFTLFFPEREAWDGRDYEVSVIR